MKLLSLHIENFGKISNFDYVFKDNPSVISQPNGWGKTTFACFLKAIFFGMERRGKLKMYAAERSRFAPWQGGTYGGSVIFEHNGKTYRALRTFASTPEGDRFELVDVKTGAISRDFSVNLGEEIFGVGSETFSMTTFFGQGQLEGDINDEVRAFLTGANGLNADIEACEKAVARLDKALKNLRSQCPSSMQIEAVKERSTRLQTKQISLEEQRGECERQLDEKATQLRELPQSEAIDTNFQQKFVEKQMQLKEAESLALRQQKRRRNVKIFLSLTSILLAVSVALCGVFYASAVLCGVFGAVAAAMLFCVIVSALQLKKPTETNIDELKREVETLAARARESGRAFEFLQKRAALEREIAVIEERLKTQQVELSRNLELLDEAEEQLETLQEKRAEVEKKIKLISFVKETMLQAKQNVSVRFVEPMQEKLLSLLSMLSKDKLAARVDYDLDVKVDTQIGLVEKQFLSQGKRDLFAICKRFALIEAVFGKTSPFIVLDDPFVNLDDETLKNCLALVQELSKRYQIIYLTCHSSRK